MPIDPNLLSVLADPADHGPLRAAGDELVNPRLGLSYPVRDGVPVLLASAARPVAQACGTAAEGPAGPEETGSGSAASFDGVASWYDRVMQDPGAHGPLTALVNDLVVAELGAGSGTVLDVACGTGLLPRWLAPLGWTVLGLDYSADQLRIAKGRLPVVQGDAGALPVLDGVLDAVVTTFSAAPDLDAAAREVARVLRPGGRHVAVFVHPVLNGSLSTRGENGSVTVGAGYHDSVRLPPDQHASTVRGRVGAVHRPLDVRLGAYLAAGLRLERFHEVAETPQVAPTSILTAWTRN